MSIQSRQACAAYEKAGRLDYRHCPAFFIQAVEIFLLKGIAISGVGFGFYRLYVNRYNLLG